MTIRRHLLFVFVALFGLLSPSFAAGFGALAASTATPAITMADDAAPTVPHYKPCEKQGGKRVAPCHPDLGILTVVSETAGWAPAGRRLPLAEPMRRLPVPTTDPPPPRRS